MLATRFRALSRVLGWFSFSGAFCLVGKHGTSELLGLTNRSYDYLLARKCIVADVGGVEALFSAKPHGHVSAARFAAPVAME